jgi:hypothetical protein
MDKGWSGLEGSPERCYGAAAAAVGDLRTRRYRSARAASRIA